jgi:phage terminase large subunit-like protein
MAQPARHGERGGKLYPPAIQSSAPEHQKRGLIDGLRVEEHQLPPLKRIVATIDPSASSAEDANECGIVCAGLGDDDHAYILDDVSGVMMPNEWATEAIALLRLRRDDRIISEINNGGDMVENTLRLIDPAVPYGSVWASRGKFTRAEPVSGLYKQGRVHHVGPFPRLEDQMCAFTIDFDRKIMGYSPDRVDALVWVLTELMIEGIGQRRLLLCERTSGYLNRRFSRESCPIVVQPISFIPRSISARMMPSARSTPGWPAAASG